MSKRRSNVSQRSENSSDSDAENYNDSQSGKKICNIATRSQNSTRNSVKRKMLTKEDNEHTYSNTPIFSNVECERVLSDECDSDSDYEGNNQISSRISVRSTSSDSTKSVISNRGKFNQFQADHEMKASSKRKPKCFSKNAVMARVNRQRKKEYVEKLEGDIDCLKEKYSNVQLKLDEQTQLVEKLKKQVRYLHSTLINSKEIGTMLRRICGTNEKTSFMTSPLLATPPPDHEVNISGADYEDHADELWPAVDLPVNNNVSKPCDETMTDTEPTSEGGVCFHVSKDKVSYGFCEPCSYQELLGVMGDADISLVKW